MRLLSSLHLPLVLYVLLHLMFPTLHAAKEKAGAAMDPSGSREITAPTGPSVPPSVTGPGTNIPPAP